MLEPVTAAASDDPAIAPLRVPVDQQVTIVAILILAYARLSEGAPGDIRDTPRQIGPDVRDRSVGYAPVADVGVIFQPMGNELHLEPHRLHSGQNIVKTLAAHNAHGGQPARTHIVRGQEVSVQITTGGTRTSY